MKFQFLNRLTEFLTRLDSWLRKRDWAWNRAYLAETARPKWLSLRAYGHAPTAVLLFLLLVPFVVFGPTLEYRGVVPILFVVVSWVAVLAVKTLFQNDRWLVWLEIAAVLVVGVVTWFVLADADTKERSGEVYRHIFVPLVIPLILITLIAKGLAWWLFQRYVGQFGNLLKARELFVRRQTVQISYKRFLRNLLATPIYHPFQFLYPPALMVLLFADRTLMLIVATATLLIWWFVLTASDVVDRLGEMVDIFRRSFLVGGQLVVSLFVIGLAVARLLDIHYVTTLIESSATWGNTSILFIILTVYVFFWFYGYWSSRILGEQIVGVFRASGDEKDRGRIRYDIEPDKVTTDVLPEGRFLQVHGAARFVAAGTYKKENNSGEAWHFYDRDRLIDAVVNEGDGHPPEVLDDAAVIKQRARFYNVAMNFILVIILGTVFYELAQLPHKAVVTASEATAPESKNPALIDLNTLLLASAPEGECGPQQGEPRILLAASGGGTRAALYTASVLRGLAELNLACNLVLASGVSGGSAALAYFAGHIEELRSDRVDPKAWAKFSAMMAEPFIQDALEGVFEWRVAAGGKVKSRGSDNIY